MSCEAHRDQTFFSWFYRLAWPLTGYIRRFALHSGNNEWRRACVPDLKLVIYNYSNRYAPKIIRGIVVYKCELGRGYNSPCSQGWLVLGIYSAKKKKRQTNKNK